MSGYDFRGAARDSLDGGDAASSSASASGLGFNTGLAFSDSDRSTLMNGGSLPDSAVPVGFSRPPSGLAGIDGRGIDGSSSTGGTNLSPQVNVGLAYAEGGAIPTEDDNPMMDTFGSQMQLDINAALKTVGDVFSYGRRLHGLESGDKQAANMPTKPFSETPKPQPMMPPSALPYGPGEKPFGRRSEGEEGAINTAGVLPSVPFSETPKPQPMPGPLPPTNNPFGKRVSENTATDADGDNDGDTGAINTDDEEAA